MNKTPENYTEISNQLKKKKLWRWFFRSRGSSSRSGSSSIDTDKLIILS